MKTPDVSGESAHGKTSNKTKSLIIATLAILLLMSGSYLIYVRSENKKLVEQKSNQINNLSLQKSELQSSFDASLTKIESLQSENEKIQNKLTEQNDVIAKSKEEIRTILKKKIISEKDLTKAKKLIDNLNITISNMQQEVAKLTLENKTLGEEKARLSSENASLANNLNITKAQNEELEQKVDIASTLNASNISIQPIKVKKNGKEKNTLVAKRTDKLMVSFDVANRIIKPGMTNLYVLVIGPDGKAITAGLQSSSMFDTREEGSKYFTAMLPVELETSKTKNVTFSFMPQSEFIEGDYKIEIYQNGFLIGEGTKTLRKAGMFI